MDQAVAALAGWGNFYVIVGSGAAALTGLQFVVMVLGAQVNVTSESAVRAFGTPTIVHFCAVVLISAILTAPWSSSSNAGLAVGACGAAGLVYSIVVVGRARRQTSYEPVLEDWIWHGALPIAAYGALVGAVLVLRAHPQTSLFVIGGAAVLLLFIGIHNAWDSVTYLAHARGGRDRP